MDDAITVSAPVRFRRWTTPNFATQDVPPRPRSEGFQEAPSTPIAELAPEVLNALAQAWLNDLYTKAGHSPPRIVIGALLPLYKRQC